MLDTVVPKAVIRNKNCKECPQNEREDVVWRKGVYDGMDLGKIGEREKLLPKLYTIQASIPLLWGKSARKLMKELIEEELEKA